MTLDLGERLYDVAIRNDLRKGDRDWVSFAVGRTLYRDEPEERRYGVVTRLCSKIVTVPGIETQRISKEEAERLVREFNEQEPEGIWFDQMASPPSSG